VGSVRSRAAFRTVLMEPCVGSVDDDLAAGRPFYLCVGPIEFWIPINANGCICLLANRDFKIVCKLTSERKLRYELRLQFLSKDGQYKDVPDEKTQSTQPPHLSMAVGGKQKQKAIMMETSKGVFTAEKLRVTGIGKLNWDDAEFKSAKKGPLTPYRLCVVKIDECDRDIPGGLVAVVDATFHIKTQQRRTEKRELKRKAVGTSGGGASASGASASGASASGASAGGASAGGASAGGGAASGASGVEESLRRCRATKCDCKEPDCTVATAPSGGPPAVALEVVQLTFQGVSKPRPEGPEPSAPTMKGPPAKKRRRADPARDAAAPSAGAPSDQQTELPTEAPLQTGELAHAPLQTEELAHAPLQTGELTHAPLQTGEDESETCILGRAFIILESVAKKQISFLRRILVAMTIAMKEHTDALEEAVQTMVCEAANDTENASVRAIVQQIEALRQDIDKPVVEGEPLSHRLRMLIDQTSTLLQSDMIINQDLDADEEEAGSWSTNLASSDHATAVPPNGHAQAAPPNGHATAAPHDGHAEAESRIVLPLRDVSRSRFSQLTLRNASSASGSTDVQVPVRVFDLVSESESEKTEDFDIGHVSFCLLEDICCRAMKLYDQVEATKSPKVPPKPCSHYESHELEIQCMYKLRDYLGEANADRLDSFCAALDRYHQACHPYRLEFTSPEQVASLKDFKLDVSDPSRDFYISHVAAARELMASTVV